ncbi:MAG: DUF5906 domain-containing protein [Mycoplasma sp.]
MKPEKKITFEEARLIQTKIKDRELHEDERGAVQAFISACMIKNIDGTIWFLENWNSNFPVWVSDDQSLKNQSPLLSIIYKYGYSSLIGLSPNTGWKQTYAKQLYDAIYIWLGTEKTFFKLKKGESHSIFFPNGVLTPKGFKPNPFPEFNLFTLNVEYKNKCVKSKMVKLERVLDLLFPNPEIKEYALAIYATACMPWCPTLAVFNVGLGSNGKTWFLDFLIEVVGKQYTGPFSPPEKSDEKFAFSEFKNKMLIVTQESDGKIIPAKILKEATTAGTIKIERKNQPFQQITNYSTYITNSNFDPHYTDSSSGVSRRIKIIPYDTQDIQTKKGALTEEESNEVIHDKDYHLCLLVLMYQAFLKVYDFKTKSFNEPAIVKEKLNYLKKENLPIFKWLEEAEVIENYVSNWEFAQERDEDGELLWIPLNVLHNSYKEFVMNNLSGLKPLGIRSFNQDLQNIIAANYKERFKFFTRNRNWTNPDSKQRSNSIHFCFYRNTPEHKIIIQNWELKNPSVVSKTKSNVTQTTTPKINETSPDRVVGIDTNVSTTEVNFEDLISNTNIELTDNFEIKLTSEEELIENDFFEILETLETLDDSDEGDNGE